MMSGSHVGVNVREVSTMCLTGSAAIQECISCTDLPGRVFI